MRYIIISWLISALSILIVGHLIPGFEVQSFASALIAAVVIGLINATVGLFVKNYYNTYFDPDIRYFSSDYKCPYADVCFLITLRIYGKWILGCIFRFNSTCDYKYDYKKLDRNRISLFVGFNYYLY